MKNIDKYRGCLIGGAAGNALGYPRDPRKRRYYRGGLLRPSHYRQFISNNPPNYIVIIPIACYTKSIKINAKIRRHEIWNT